MATIQLSPADDGRTVTARPGDEIVVVLPENATTGFRWHLDVVDGILALVSDGYVTLAEADAEPRVGRGGLREFRFQVGAPGAGSLALKHWQEWEGEASVTMRFSLRVEALEPTQA